MQKYYFRLVFVHKNLFFSIILVALGTNVNKKKRKVEKKLQKFLRLKISSYLCIRNQATRIA